MSVFTTPDLSDVHPEACHLPFQFRLFGQRSRFYGRVSTVSCEIDNSRVAEAVSESGEGRVLLVDGQGLLHRSLLGDRLAQLAHALVRLGEAEQRLAVGVVNGENNVARRDGQRVLGQLEGCRR